MCNRQRDLLGGWTLIATALQNQFDVFVRAGIQTQCALASSLDTIISPGPGKANYAKAGSETLLGMQLAAHDRVGSIGDRRTNLHRPAPDPIWCPLDVLLLVALVMARHVVL